MNMIPQPAQDRIPSPAGCDGPTLYAEVKGHPRDFAASVRRAMLLGLGLAALVSAGARADEFSWDATAKDDVVCKAVQNNIRFFYITFNNSPDTYQEVKTYMHDQLTGKGDRETQLMAVYDTLLPRLEAGDFKPPAVESVGAGRRKLLDDAQTTCVAKFP